MMPIPGSADFDEAYFLHGMNDPGMNGRATTLGVFKAYVVFLYVGTAEPIMDLSQAEAEEIDLSSLLQSSEVTSEARKILTKWRTKIAEARVSITWTIPLDLAKVHPSTKLWLHTSKLLAPRSGKGHRLGNPDV